MPGTHAELGAVGVSSTRQVQALVEALSRWRRVWRAEEPGIDLQPAPSRPTGPPLWLAAQGPRMLGIAGETCDGWLSFSPTPGQFAAAFDTVRLAAEQSGRDPNKFTPAAYLTVALRDPDDAAEQLDRYMYAYYGLGTDTMSEVPGLLRLGPPSQPRTGQLLTSRRALATSFWDSLGQRCGTTTTMQQPSSRPSGPHWPRRATVSGGTDATEPTEMTNTGQRHPAASMR